MIRSPSPFNTLLSEVVLKLFFCLEKYPLLFALLPLTKRMTRATAPAQLQKKVKKKMTLTHTNFLSRVAYHVVVAAIIPINTIRTYTSWYTRFSIGLPHIHRIYIASPPCIT